MQVRKAILGDIDFIMKLYGGSKLGEIEKIELENMISDLISSNNQDIFIIDYLGENFGIMIMNARIDLNHRGMILRFTDLKLKNPDLPIGKEILSWAETYAREMDYLKLEILSDISKSSSHEFYKNEGFKMTEYGFSKEVNVKINHI